MDHSLHVLCAFARRLPGATNFTRKDLDMENNSNTESKSPKPEATRAGGPDDTREPKESNDTQKSEETKKEEVVWR